MQGAYMTRRRIFRIILLPILAPIFLIGWLFTFMGTHKQSAKTAHGNLAINSKETGIEIGVLADGKEITIATD
jgi:ABC-type maltose transport system permease subunit